MPKVTVTDAQGLVQSAGSGVTITSNLTVDGSATFTGTVTGVTAAPTVNVNETDDASLVSPETYDLSNNVRVIRYNSAPGGGWTIAALTNTGLSTGQATTLKVLFPGPAADRTITISGITVDGVAAAQVNPGSLKAKKDGKGNGIALDVINSAGDYYVYGSVLADGN